MYLSFNFTTFSHNLVFVCDNYLLLIFIKIVFTVRLSTLYFLSSTMKNHCRIYFIFLPIFLFSTVNLFAQSLNTIELGYASFDKLVGVENTSLFQGILYTESYRTVNDLKPFFKSTDFLYGNIWYKGQPYYNQLLKYDVFDDELLILLGDKGNTLRLSKKDVDSFTIQDHQFIHLKDGIDFESGYYEELFKNETFELYAKHKKKILERRSEKVVYYEFKDRKIEHLLFYQNQYHELNSKKDILQVFPNYKTQINQLYKQAKKTHNNDSNALILMVVQQLNLIIK